MEKIRYRLVYNRRKVLNAQGCALVQIEAKLCKRNVYFSTGVYIKPKCWDKKTAQVINHPQAVDLNSFLFEKIMELQNIELTMWKMKRQPTLSSLSEIYRSGNKVTLSFLPFTKEYIRLSEKEDSTKENLMSTVKMIEKYRPGIDFADLTYSYLKGFERFLHEYGCSFNTVAKHLRSLRSFINEAINEGYMSQDQYPFRKFKIKTEESKREFLTPEELNSLEKLKSDKMEGHVLDAFLFCCYSGIRISDFRSLKDENIVVINNKKWLSITMKKTKRNVNIPIEILFGGKALDILKKYDSVEDFARLPHSQDSVRYQLSAIKEKAGIKKHITFHTSRHTCATLLTYQGVPITTVQKILGHTSVKTTQIYSEVLCRTIEKDLTAVYKQ